MNIDKIYFVLWQNEQSSKIVAKICGGRHGEKIRIAESAAAICLCASLARVRVYTFVTTCMYCIYIYTRALTKSCSIREQKVKKKQLYIILKNFYYPV